MPIRILKALVVLATAAATTPTFAHEPSKPLPDGFSCQKEVGRVIPSGDGFAFTTLPAVSATMDRYPAQVGFRIRVTNTAEPSVVTGTWDSLTGLPGAIVLGDPIVGTSIPVGGTLERLVVVPVESYEACLALGGAPGELACRDGVLENRFVATHDAGSAECRARVVCMPQPQAPEGCMAPQWTGERRLHLASYTYAWGVATGCEGDVHATGVVISAATSAVVVPRGVGYVATLDASGVVAGFFRFEGTGTSVEVDALGRLDVSSRYNSWPDASPTIVRQHDAVGTVLWDHSAYEFAGGWSSSPVDIADLALDAASNVYLVHKIVREGGDTDVGVKKLTASGAVVWSRSFGTDAAEVSGRIAVGPAGEISIAGTTSGAFPGNVSAGGTDAFVAHLDANGDLLWVRQLGTAGDDAGRGVDVDASGRTALAGGIAVPLDHSIAPSSAPLAFVALFDAVGALRWRTDLAAAPVAPLSWAESMANAVAFDQVGAVWVGGEVRGVLPGATNVYVMEGPDAFLARLDASGAYLWARQFGGGRGPDRMTEVTVDAAGYGAAVGNIYVGHGSHDAFVVRVAPDGSY